MALVRVLLFGPAADAVGAGEVALEFGEAPTCAQVLVRLGEAHAGLRAIAAHGRLAVNRKIAEREAVIKGGDEVALIALVSGG